MNNIEKLLILAETYSKQVDSNINQKLNIEIKEANEILNKIKSDIAKLANISVTIRSSVKQEDISVGDDIITNYDIAESLHHLAISFIKANKNIKKFME
jgi:hypothetical protein